MTLFAGFSLEDFSAYAPEKWSSNVYNLPRRRAKGFLVSLCDAASQGLEEEFSGMERAASDEMPNMLNHKKVDAQWVYWFRDATARASLASFLEKTPLDQQKLFDIAPQDKHLVLAVVLREEHIWVGICMANGAVVDRKNFSAMLAKSWEREQFLSLLKELPDGATMHSAAGTIPAHEITLDHLANLANELGPDKPTFELGHTLPCSEAISLGADLVDLVRRWLGSLTSHYAFIAWTKQNDHIEVGKRLQEEKVQQRKKALGFGPGDKVRIISGMFSGKIGLVQNVDTKGQVKLQVGKMAILVQGNDVTPAG